MESNWPETSRNLIFGPEVAHGVSKMDQESPGLPTRVGACPLPRGQPGGPPTHFFLLYISIYPKTIREHNRSGVPPPEASVAAENQSRPVPAPCQRGQSLSGGHLHHPGALHEEEGVVLPRGWGYVPELCVWSLSLSLSCSWGGTILMYRELCYYSWILWCFSSSTLL